MTTIRRASRLVRVRYLPLVALAAGCGFSATDGGGSGTGGGGITADAPPGTMRDAPATPGIDAAPPIDAPPDAPPDAAIDAPPPMWTVIETLTVSCLGQGTTSMVVLQAGVEYRLRASGTCTANTSNGSLGDAEYVGFNINNLQDAAGGTDTGIAINDATPGSTKNPRWGAYTSTHVYEVPWMGGGGTIVARVHADNYSNNSGSLTLRILALQ